VTSRIERSFLSFIVQTGRVVDPGPIQDDSGFLHRWATIVSAAESLAEFEGEISYRVLVTGDHATVIGKLTESGDQPILVFAGRYTAVADEHGQVTHQVDASYVGLSLSDPAFESTGSSAAPPWD
jgi:hypothetical protein